MYQETFMKLGVVGKKDYFPDALLPYPAPPSLPEISAILSVCQDIKSSQIYARLGEGEVSWNINEVGYQYECL